MSGPVQQPPQQPSGQYQQPPQAPMAPPVLPKGFAVASLVLGIIGLVFSLIPMGFGVGLICDILAIIFGGVGVSKAKRGVAGGRGMAMAGLTCGILGMIVAFIWIMVIVNNPYFIEEMYGY